MVGARTNTTMSPRKPRVVLYPSPGMGHLVSMIELGKLFAARGLAVTVALIESPHDTSATGPFLAGVSAVNPAISFHRLPQVELLGSEPPEMLTFEVVRLSNPHLRDFLAGDTTAVIVLDFFCSAGAIDVAAELGIPAYFFCTSGAQILAFFLHLAVLHGKSTRSFREMDQELVHAPGVPSFPATHAIQRIMDRDSAPYKAFLNMSTDLFRSQGIIVNTFRSLEPRAMDTIVAGLSAPSGVRTPPVYCIGPLIKSEEVGVKRGDECLAWLDTQPKGSVVFLSFGSLGRFTAKQTRKVAAGLEASGQRFLWVVRSPPSDGRAKNSEKPPEPDLDALLPQGFLDRTKGRGLVVKSWAPQRAVLAHDAVGCFVTHCGWNSVLESVMAGVPMLAWPLYAVFLEKEMELAVAMEGYDKEVVEAEEVAKKVRWMMDSDGGRVLRERTSAVMRRAEEALLEGGESEATLAGLVDAWISA